MLMQAHTIFQNNDVTGEALYQQRNAG